MNTPINEYKTVVITGGPCSGKTTVIPHLKSTFEDRGVNVLTLPEAATHFFSGIGVGLSPDKLNTTDFQKELIGYQDHSERMIQRIASHYKGKTLVLLDRSVLDSGAYLGDNDFDKILAYNNLTREELLSGTRYDAIEHMVTAADGAEEFYTLGNNKARTETPEQARVLDKKTQSVYVGSPKMHVIDNSTDFESKIRRVEESISQILGIPQPVEIENKYRVIVNDWNMLKSIARPVKIEQLYLENDEGFEERIRKRSVNGISPSYYHTLKIPSDDSQRIEIEKLISEGEYMKYAMNANRRIDKTRWCFLYNNQYFEFDHFHISNKTWQKNEGALEIELISKDTPVDIPGFMRVIEDVTSNPDFKNYNCAVQMNI